MLSWKQRESLLFGESAIACGCPGAKITLFGGCGRDTTITVSTEQLHY